MKANEGMGNARKVSNVLIEGWVIEDVLKSLISILSLNPLGFIVRSREIIVFMLVVCDNCFSLKEYKGNCIMMANSGISHIFHILHTWPNKRVL